MCGLSEENIISGLSENTESAYKSLVLLYEKKLLNAVNKIVRDEDAAMDIVQETFIAFFINAAKFEGRSKIYTWLYRVAANKSIDFVRKKIRERKNVVKTSQSEVLQDGRENKSVIKLVMSEALSKLEDEFKIPLLLAEYDSMSYQNIARELDIPVNTVRTRIFRARKKMLAILKSKGVSL